MTTRAENYFCWKTKSHTWHLPLRLWCGTAEGDLFLSAHLACLFGLAYDVIAETNFQNLQGFSWISFPNIPRYFFEFALYFQTYPSVKMVIMVYNKLITHISSVIAAWISTKCLRKRIIVNVLGKPLDTLLQMRSDFVRSYHDNHSSAVPLLKRFLTLIRVAMNNTSAHRFNMYWQDNDRLTFGMFHLIEGLEIKRH